LDTIPHMRTVLSIALMGVTACGFSSPGASAGSSGDDSSNPVLDAPQGNPTASDDDGDGVPNAVDNCPQVANRDQANEDGDSRGDACDPCPQLAAPADDVDSDGDGIGDGCDPHPSAAGDKLVYWNGFHVAGSGLPSGLSQIHGSSQLWSVANDYLVFSPNNEDFNVPAFDTGAQSHTVDATFEITASHPGVFASAAGVAADITSNDDDVIECQARTDMQERELWYWNGRGAGAWTALDTAAATTPNSVYRIVLHRNPSDLACATIRNGVTTALTNPGDSLKHTRAGLFARNVDVRFRYLAIYTSP
jgi:Thrombospondin type 3 repeat